MRARTTADPFARGLGIADAVLWEGYVLYPYRGSAVKNRFRFNWGVVGPAEEPSMASTVIVDPGVATVDIRVRFLRLVTRADGWDEGEPVDIDLTVQLSTAAATPQRCTIDLPGSVEVDAGGTARRRSPLHGQVLVSARESHGHLLVTTEVTNDTSCGPETREEALRHSFVGCHILLAAPGDAFVSVIEPPDALADLAAGLTQHRAWPVLVGPGGARDLVLASPVILYDHPSVAERSAGDFHDGTEIDEMLALRVHTLTEEEKAEARALDPRTRAIIDRHDALEPTTMAELHGTVGTSGTPANDTTPADPHPEWSEAGPDTALVGGTWVRPGSKVRLEPVKRSDIHDMFLKGRIATVAQVVHDVDGEMHVAVTVDDDPAADLFAEQRRYLYFAADELVALDGEPVPGGGERG